MVAATVLPAKTNSLPDKTKHLEDLSLRKAYVVCLHSITSQCQGMKIFIFKNYHIINNAFPSLEKARKGNVVAQLIID